MYRFGGGRCGSTRAKSQTGWRSVSGAAIQCGNVDASEPDWFVGIVSRSSRRKPSNRITARARARTPPSSRNRASGRTLSPPVYRSEVLRRGGRRTASTDATARLLVDAHVCSSNRESSVPTRFAGVCEATRGPGGRTAASTAALPCARASDDHRRERSFGVRGLTRIVAMPSQR